jgi:N-methylhydantoinase A
MSPSPAQHSRIGVDIGGTFTDLVWVDDATGAVQVRKLLTTPGIPSQAIEQGVVTVLHDAGDGPPMSAR